MSQTIDEKIAALGEQIEERGRLTAEVWALRQRIGEIDRNAEFLIARHQDLTGPLREEVLFNQQDAAMRRIENMRTIAQADACLAEAKAASVAEKREIEQQIETLQSRIDELS